MLYPPWKSSVEETKNGAATFAESLEQYLWDHNFPRHIASDIYKRKTQWAFAHSAGDEYMQEGEETGGTPTDGRTDPRIEEAAAAALNPTEAGYTGADDMRDADLQE
jgi:hypothetical protein